MFSNNLRNIPSNRTYFYHFTELLKAFPDYFESRRGNISVAVSKRYGYSYKNPTIDPIYKREITCEHIFDHLRILV